MIVGLLREPLAVKLLFAFREDYLGRVKQLLAARPELVDQALRLGPPAADALTTIIRGPFERFPGRYQRELDQSLAKRLGAALAQRFGSGEVSLSEVQTVCLRLWRSADPGELLAREGVQGLLEDDLGEALDTFAPDLRAAAIALLSEMVTAAGTRNVVSAQDLRQRLIDEHHDISASLFDEALKRLERDSKLVRRERRRDLDLYEITSEFLVPWISQRRDELRHAQERRRERRRLRIIASIAAALVILATVVAAIVIGQQAEAQRERAKAELQASNATSLALAASSVEPLTTRPDVSLALAFEAYRERPLPEAHAATIRALLAARRSGLRTVLTGHTSAVSAVAFSPDGKTLASASDDRTVGLWSVATHKSLGRLSGHTNTVRAVAFSPDGKTLASASDDDTVRLWSVATRKSLGRLSGHTEGVEGVAFSPDGTTLAGGSSDRTVRLWSVATHKSLRRLSGHTGPISAVAFSPDGKTLASASSDETVRLWNVANHKSLGRLSGHTGPISAVAFSPDGKTLASASYDRTVRLWSVATHRSLGRLSGHTGPISAVAFSPDGKTLAGARYDRTVGLWSVATRKSLGRLSGHTSAVSAVAFSPDGKTLASASYDRTVRLWNDVLWRKVTELHATVCDVLRTGLNRSDWAQYAPGISYRRSCP